jgi:transcriptional regulator with XRE-family HTH domain
MAKALREAAIHRIGERLRQLRLARGWSQVELAQRLELSQSRLSDVERGQRSLTAEEFLDVLRLFNVPATDFASQARASESQMQNALERLGARHLRENPDVLPSEAFKETGDLVREVLIAAESPRQISGLAAVLVARADQVNFEQLHAQLRGIGLQGRLGWLLDNTVQAAIHELEGSLPRRWRLPYQRAIVLLQNALARVRGTTSARRVRWRSTAVDILDRDVRSEKTASALLAGGSPISRSWNIVTAIQLEDFVEALRASRVGD